MMLKKLMYQFVLFCCLAFLLSGCSSDKGTNSERDSAEESIGPEGGTIMLESKVVVVVPPEALSETVNMTITENISPTPIGGTMKFVSPVYTIGPSGTDFNSPVGITIMYNQASCGGADENSVTVYTNEGSGWEELTTTVAADLNAAAVLVSHLSNFAAAVDTSAAAEGVFAAMAVGRTITPIGDELIKIDLITARFDSSLAPCTPISPQQATSVMCNEYELSWASETDMYQYIGSEIIEFGGQYIFEIEGNASVPSFADTIDFPVDETYITDPVPNALKSLSGFSVIWENGTGAGNVYLFILDIESDTAVFVETANDGNYTFNSTALNGLTAGYYGLLLVHENWDYITAEGIDPTSFIRARVINTVQIILQ